MKRRENIKVAIRPMDSITRYTSLAYAREVNKKRQLNVKSAHQVNYGNQD